MSKLRASTDKSSAYKFKDDRARAIRKQKLAKARTAWLEDCELKETVGQPTIPWAEWNKEVLTR